MKVEALTTSAPSPGAKIDIAFRAGDVFEVTNAQFKELSAIGAVRSLDPVPPPSIVTDKKNKNTKAEESGNAAEPNADASGSATGDAENVAG